MERVEKTRSEAASWHPKLVSPNFVSVSLCYANRERERERGRFICVWPYNIIQLDTLVLAQVSSRIACS